MKRSFFFLALAVIYLVLAQQLDTLTVIAALLFSGFILWWQQALLVDLTRPKKILHIIQLVGFVLVDIVRSAIAVAILIAFQKHQQRHSQFIYVPLTLTNKSALSVLSAIINLTPGTVWVEVLPKQHQLLLQVFDLKDEAWWVDIINNYYEKKLALIFSEHEHSTVL